MRTAADQLAELLTKNNYNVIKVSTIVNMPARLLDTIFAVVFKSFAYKIAVVPVYGNRLSFIWEIVTVSLLRLMQKKVVLVVHGGRLPAKMERNAAKYLRIFRKGDLVVCPSGYLRAALATHGVESIEIENVVNLNDYIFRNKTVFEPRIFWMRTLEDVYNPEMAVRVAALLVAKYANLQMVMAGYDRGSLQMVKDLAVQLGISDKISFPGYISNQQKNSFASSLDIYICTNRVDNAPVSLVEMMALGLPVVAVKTGGIPYMVQHGHNGLLVDLDDDAAMADSISRIIDSPALGRQLVENGLQFSKQFGEPAVLHKWQSVFDQFGYKQAV